MKQKTFSFLGGKHFWLFLCICFSSASTAGSLLVLLDALFDQSQPYLEVKSPLSAASNRFPLSLSVF